MALVDTAKSQEAAKPAQRSLLDPRPPLDIGRRLVDVAAEVGFEVVSVSCAHGGDAMPAEPRYPAGPAARDDVVGLARKAPVADRWMQRDRFAVVGQPPFRRR